MKAVIPIIALVLTVMLCHNACKHTLTNKEMFADCDTSLLNDRKQYISYKQYFKLGYGKYTSFKTRGHTLYGKRADNQILELIDSNVRSIFDTTNFQSWVLSDKYDYAFALKKVKVNFSDSSSLTFSDMSCACKSELKNLPSKFFEGIDVKLIMSPGTGCAYGSAEVILEPIESFISPNDGSLDFLRHQSIIVSITEDMQRNINRLYDSINSQGKDGLFYRVYEGKLKYVKDMPTGNNSPLSIQSGTHAYTGFVLFPYKHCYIVK